MKNRIISLGMILLFAMSVTSCEDLIEPQIENIQFSRVFRPLNLTAIIRNKTTVELNWAVKQDAKEYVVEISEDAGFANIVKTENVSPDELPVRILLDGETLYYARVKGISEGTADSKWSVISFQTDPENIFNPLAPEDIKATMVTLSWPENSDVTHFLIIPGNTERQITAEEKAAGEATIENLASETNYTIKLMKGTKQRGAVDFKTLVDIGNATAVHPEDDLNTAIAAAQSGDVLVLFPGDHLVYQGRITINKSISIKGLYPHDKPKVHVQFVLEDGVQNVEVSNLEMTGDYLNSETGLQEVLDHAFQYTTSETSYGALSVSGCYIHGFTKSLFSGASPNVASSVQSILLDNSIVKNILTVSADFIDFRNGHVTSLTLQNSTFINCAPARDFIRLDNSSATFPGQTSKVTIDHCTIYKVSDGNSRRILYVRFVDNELSVKNTIIAETAGIFTNQALSTQPVCDKNNYFNAPGFTDAAYVANVKIDVSGTFTTLDPGFANPDNDDFTISNQSLIDKGIGDPRWLP